MTTSEGQAAPAALFPARRRFHLSKERITAAMFLAANAVVNVMTFAFHLIFSRSLGPAAYSALGALLAVILVSSVPLGAIQLAAAKVEAIAPGAAGLRTLTRLLAAASVTAFAVLVLLAPLLDDFLHLQGRGSIALVALWIVLATASSVPQGVLIGASRFREVSLALVVGGGVARLALGLGLNAAGAGLNGALGAVAGGQFVSLLLLLIPLRHRLLSRAVGLRVSVSDGFNALGALTGLAVFGSVDDVLARHLFVGSKAGFYVAAATSGRIVLFAPGALALLVFPRVAALEADQRAARRLMVRALAAVSVAGAFIAAVFLALPRQMIDLIFGSSYEPARPLLAPLVIAGCLMGVVNLAAYFLIARGSVAASLSWAATLAVVAYAYGASVDARSLAWGVLVVAGCAAGLSLLATFRPQAASRLAT